MRSCPNCHQSLSEEQLHGETVDRCEICDGLWFDYSELGTILRHTPPPSDRTVAVTCSENAQCPQCDESLLSPFNYAYDSGVLINKCGTCAGVWVESEQLELLAQYRSGTPAVQRLGDAMSDDIQSSNKPSFVRSVLRSRLLSGVVALGYLISILLFVGNPRAILGAMPYLLLPMACIWFPDSMGRATSNRITHSTPGDFVAIAGWLVLLTTIVCRLLLLVALVPNN